MVARLKHLLLTQQTILEHLLQVTTPDILQYCSIKVQVGQQEQALLQMKLKNLD